MVRRLCVKRLGGKSIEAFVFFDSSSIELYHIMIVLSSSIDKRQGLHVSATAKEFFDYRCENGVVLRHRLEKGHTGAEFYVVYGTTHYAHGVSGR